MKPIAAFFRRRIDSRAIGLFRIGFAAVGLFYAVGAIQLVDVAWVRHTGLATAGYLAWLAILVLLLIGWRSRLMAAAAFACVLVLNANPMAGAVGELMYRIGGLFLVWMDSGAALSLDARRRRGAAAPPSMQPRWPADLAVLSIGLSLMLAGLPKTVSPIWRQGDGFYVAMLLPWTHHDWMSFVAGSRAATWLGNYMGMAAESGCVLLLFIPYLRWLGIAAFLGLMFGFGVAMSFYFIALAGLMFLPLMLPDSKGVWPWRWPKPSAGEAIPQPPRSPGSGARLFALGHLAYIAVFAAAAIAANFGSGSALGRLGAFRPTRVYNRYTNDIRPLPLFCEVHLYGTFVYRVEGLTPTGLRVELLPVFTDRGSPGSCCVAGPRYLEGLMFHVTDDAIRMAGDPGYRPDGEHMTEYRAVLGKAIRSTPTALRQVRILIKVLNPPRTFQGAVAPWDAEQWLPWIAFDVTGQELAPEAQFLAAPPPPLFTVRS